MTGFGLVTRSYTDKTISIEVRSLNSKMTDLRIKMPTAYRSKEHEIRKILLDFAERGKIDAAINVRSADGDDGFNFNKALFERYCKAISASADALGIEKGDIVQSVMRIDAITNSEQVELPEEEWERIAETLNEALQQFQAFRRREGLSMQTDILARVRHISSLLVEVEPFEIERIAKIRQRMRQHLEEFLGRESVDNNRFEQEVIYYLEKIDITEEKLRLEEHCRHFIEQVDGKATAQGRTLNFIAQEIGREVNTLGAKAYSADIQRIVIQMKDELEKVKEIVANLV